MKSSFDRQRIALRIVVTSAVLVVLVLAIQDFYQVAEGTRNWIGKFTLTWGIPLAGMMLFGGLAFVMGMLSMWIPARVESINRTLAGWRDRIGWLRWLMFVVLALIPAKIFLYTPLGFKLIGSAFRLAFLLAVVIAMALFATRDQEKLIRWRPLLLSFVFAGVVFVFAKEFVMVTDYPLSLTWSEGNRIWDYSWLYGRRLYDYPFDVKFEAYIDIGRQSLWGLPFLLDNVTILHTRLWSALVFTVPYICLGWMAFRPLPEKLKDWVWVGVWGFLFLHQGPIYTPLVLSAILVAGARHKPIWLALPLIYLAGYYAQLSRLTWMIAPAIWAVMIALLDGADQNGERFTWREWAKVIVYGLAGSLGGVGILRGWNRLTYYLGKVAATNSEVVGTVVPGVAFTDTSDAVEAVSSGGNSFLTDQPLLWERLWPNPTNDLGIILELLLATAPLIILLVYLIYTKRWKLGLWQKIIPLAGLLVFLGFGIVISVKIGGGSNLHNVDMFLISLIFIAGIAWEHTGYKMLANLDAENIALKILMLLMVMIPAFMPLVGTTPLELPLEEYVEHTIDLLKAETSVVVSEGGEVLFMDQRQLLTFGVIQAPLVPEYEKKIVMDRALAEDQDYFSSFYEDLAKQRFSLIITDPQRIRYSREEEQWGAENDAWVQWVTEPLYCFYEPKYSKDKTHVWFFVPRTDVTDCTFQP